MGDKTLTITRQFKDVFGERNFRLLFLARFISNVGNGIGPIALAFGVLDLAGANATSLSLVMAARTLPLIRSEETRLNSSHIPLSRMPSSA